MSNHKISSEILKELRESLPHGAITEIAKDLNYTREYVSYVLNGHKNNEDIILAAVEKIQFIKYNKTELEGLIKDTVERQRAQV